jgi:hypothetical protein
MATPPRGCVQAIPLNERCQFRFVAGNRGGGGGAAAPAALHVSDARRQPRMWAFNSAKGAPRSSGWSKGDFGSFSLSGLSTNGLRRAP